MHCRWPGSSSSCALRHDLSLLRDEADQSAADHVKIYDNRLVQAESSGTVVKFLADNKSMVTSGQVSAWLFLFAVLACHAAAQQTPECFPEKAVKHLACTCVTVQKRSQSRLITVCLQALLLIKP